MLCNSVLCLTSLQVISVVSSSFLSNVPAAVLVTALVSQTFKGNEASSWPRCAWLGLAFALALGGQPPTRISAYVAKTGVFFAF